MMKNMDINIIYLHYNVALFSQCQFPWAL